MPPLSAYTPFESLLFFQSLAALDTRPSNFVSISDVLRNNPFIRQHVAFDAGRLAPEALEELYTTLMHDGNPQDLISSLEPNGHHVETNGVSNPKKRKIASPRPDGLGDKGLSHAAIVPDVVSHLYARYKELVSREIRNEEVKYNEIKGEIERLQREEREAPKESTSTPAVSQMPIPQVSKTKNNEPEPEPEPMDVDTKEEEPGPNPVEIANQSPVVPSPTAAVERPESEQQREEEKNKTIPAKPTTSPVPSEQQPPPPPPVEPQKGQKQTVPPSAQHEPQPQSPQPPLQPAHPLPPPPQQQPPPPPPAVLAPQPVPQTIPKPLQSPGANGKAKEAPQQPAPAPQTSQADEGSTDVPATQPSFPPPVAPVPNTSARPALPATPSQTIWNSSTTATSLPPKPSPTDKPASKQGSTKAPPVPRLPPQSSFQQWSLNEPPQTPHQASSKPTPEPVRQAAGRIPTSRPSQPQSKPEAKGGFQTPQPITVPSTPRPVSAAVQSPAPSGYSTGFETPVGAAQALLFSEARKGRPRLSIATPGSLTPWKKTPRLSMPESPRSPERPRPEDVSPISEKAPSLIGSREATPEEPEPRPRKRRNEGKGSMRGRDSGLMVEIENKGGLKPKSDKASLSVGKGRDRSTASSRSRGRSVLSRDDESEPLGKIKHEMPSTPAGISDAAEMDHRPSSGRKGTAPSEDRPGRGRPKRKRGISETLEQEPFHSEISPLNRIDPNQSTSYILCARNFPRTGAPIMNDVTMHKHASIFTKPLTERDAPGYRDLIYRPQDLKSIKSMIHQGSKALAAATEAANTPVADGESPAPNTGTPSKNAVLMLQKNEDVIPPKGIVNSAQLEKELIRMFANAVMFNPVPQRGFGPAFPMTNDGGSRESTQVPELDEGGIIKDTIEMFEDVEQAVTRWRAAERTADELASKSILSLRRGSASDLNTDSADEVKG
ncbi:hypothetical protein BDV25DRAFT_156528 [Aspergillus avenaceus]|uniref:Bromo domain-containing protein n=1 Tax=Aspergillus avenaceus TaxID=36643 RepID=A0A5N6TSJ8_ASPAV|nr:hypothetical protein BDV25DRAFT_156528 [Aspergillus avenaceus]